MTAFQGIWVPLITPFRNNQPDLAALQRLTQHLLQQGVDGLVVCGTTGEPATLSHDEQLGVLAAVREVAGEQCPLVFGVGGNDTAAMLEQLRTLEREPVAGWLISAPYYTRPSQEGIRRHFEALAAGTEKPILLYNVPYRSGVAMETATLLALAQNPRIAGIKQSAGYDLDQLSALIHDTPLQVLSGEDALIFTCACLGGQGAIAAAAHIRPDLYRRMLAHVRAGELEAARRLHHALLPWTRLLFAEPNPAAIKAALAMMGLIPDGLRLPMVEASEGLRRRIEQVLPAVLAL
ncbi:4-hydroxy-tetrahydrodipicolinate synthase [Solimonas sp. K1W22B-7]|uniref:4-hydroxy-tetrahydrodipicolinate synthase n=1 Tax=Solimonas sp. K1W22B-7 TaxID=2303331 RepID=UPI000E331FBF|nr:4-hydroxy-tetrahydrodipicolinate synthase [Solimonas sp. K1W22B-7]AXQ28098.1 4-hydroxy-tetrahydrodipicolinate synthase [Solimonas sp. K1W22B-7]